MKISKQKAADDIVSFLAGEAVKIQNMTERFKVFAMLGAAKIHPETLLKPFEGNLKMLGVIDGEELIDLDSVHAAMEMAFNNVPTFQALGFTFTRDDSDTLLRRMMQ